MVGTVVAVNATSASAATVDTNAWYMLINRNSGKAIDICSNSTADGACVQQYTRHNGNNQQFQFVSSGGGYYRIKARHSGKVLDDYNFATANGSPVRQWADLNGVNQQWSLLDSDSGYVRFINRTSAKAMEVQNASTADGGAIVQYTDWGGTNQQWQLVVVGGSTPPTTTAAPPTTSSPQPPPTQGTCDIYASGGTPCVAAHSTVRALFGSYNGRLYQVRRSSDNTTRNIGVLSAGGLANAAAQDSFCAGTSCVVTVIYDQSGRGNDLCTRDRPRTGAPQRRRRTRPPSR